MTIPSQRLASQGIAPTKFAGVHDVVRWLGALQGQDYGGALWSIGLRLPGSTVAVVEQAIQNKTIVRSWVLRGTLHFVAATDLRWLLALLAPRLKTALRGRWQQLELDEATFLRSNRLIEQALRDGQALSRPALFAILEEHGLATGGQRGVHMLSKASLDGLICQGVAQRNVPTFMAIDETLANGPRLTRDQALAELARRYFTSHGPAKLKDFAWWSGLAIAEARAGLAAVQETLAHETHAGQSYWLAESTPSNHQDPRRLHLLPGFDEYLLGYADRSMVLEPEYANRVVPGGNGVFYPTIVSDGRVVGTWKRSVKKNTILMSASPFTSLSAAEDAEFSAAASRYAEFHNLSLHPS
jgi:hypothetical protein